MYHFCPRFEKHNDGTIRFVPSRWATQLYALSGIHPISSVGRPSRAVSSLILLLHDLLHHLNVRPTSRRVT